MNLLSKFTTRLRDGLDGLTAVARARGWTLSPRARAATLVAAVALAPFLLTSLFPAVGTALEERLHWEPMQILRRQLGLSPTLDARLKVIVIDDGTLSFLGRHPTFGDIEDVAALLAASGFRKVLVNGFFDLQSQTGVTRQRSPKVDIPIITAVAVLPGNLRTVRSKSLGELPRRLWLPAADAPPMELAVNGMVSAAPVLAASGALGAINSLGAYRAPAGFRIGTGEVIPHLSLYAGDAPTDALNEDLLVDFVAFGELARAMIPMRWFYQTPTTPLTTLGDRPDGQEGADDQDAKKIRDALAGGEVALIIPDGYTGGRTISSPDGLVPSYLGTVSLANAALRQRLLRVAFPPVVAQLITGVVAFGAVQLLSAPAALAGILALFLLLFAASGVLMVKSAVLLPALQVGAPLLLVWGRLAWTHFHNTRREKVALRHELTTSALVQKMFIPSLREGQVGAWRYKFLYEPYGDLSGDWLQVSWHRPGLGLIAIGDVVGKGASASLLTASIAALWSDFNRLGEPTTAAIEQFITRLDRFIAATFQGGQNTTLSLALLLEDQALLFSAGAPPWYKVAGRSAISRIQTPPCSPLGMHSEDEPKRLQAIPMQEGDVLLAFTDGVMDGGPARGRFVKRTQESLRQVTDENIFAVLEGEIRALPVGAALPDDFTLLMLEYRRSADEVAA